MDLTIALFGESEKGSFNELIFIDSITQLSDKLGNPPNESLGIGLAVQTLMFRNRLIFKRVDEEGFGTNEYNKGLALLKKHSEYIDGIFLPGVGEKRIIEEVQGICLKKQAMLLMNEDDFYDFLTS